MDSSYFIRRARPDKARAQVALNDAMQRPYGIEPANDRGGWGEWLGDYGSRMRDHALAYALLFWLLGNDITALLTDIEAVRVTAGALLPLVIALGITVYLAPLADKLFPWVKGIGGVSVLITAVLTGVL